MPLLEYLVASAVVFKRRVKKHFPVIFIPATLALCASCASMKTADSPVPGVDMSVAEHVKPALPVIPNRTFTLTDFGAVGDGKMMNTDAFKAAIAAVDKAGGGQLVVPRGVFLTGPFSLCSSLDLHLDGGAVIQAPDTFEALGYPNPATFKTQAEANAGFRFPRALITGRNLHDVALTGTGAIDGSGQHWWDWSERAPHARNGRVVIRRPHLVRFDGVERLHVADVTLSNSPMFHLLAEDVNELTVERVKIRAPFNTPNTDGIDPGSGTNFWIHDCDIDTGDDDIVIKSGGSNILIENNTIRHGHGISVGSPTEDGISNMLVRHCTFERSLNGIRLKSRRRSGLMENIRYTDLQMKDVEWAIVFELDYGDKTFRGNPSEVPAIHNILVDHVSIEGSHHLGIIHGLSDSRITGLTFRDMKITADEDFNLRYADAPTYEHVSKKIKPGIAPPDLPGIH